MKKSSSPGRAVSATFAWRAPNRTPIAPTTLALLCLAGGLAFAGATRVPDAALMVTTVQGDAATARLKEHGHYTSLMQAVQAARYTVETVPAPAATGGAGECVAANPAHGLRCWFRADGLELQLAAARPLSWSNLERHINLLTFTLKP